MRPNNIKYDRTMGPNSDRLDMVRTECSQTQPRAGGFSSVFVSFLFFSLTICSWEGYFEKTNRTHPAFSCGRNWNFFLSKLWFYIVLKFYPIFSGIDPDECEGEETATTTTTTATTTTTTTTATGELLIIRFPLMTLIIRQHAMCFTVVHPQASWS